MPPGRGCSETKNAVLPPCRLRNQNGYNRAGLRGHHGHARRPEPRCAAGFGRHSLGVHGGREWSGKKSTTLRTQIEHPDRAPDARPARCWSLCDGRGEQCTEGPLRPQACQMKQGRREPVPHGRRAWRRQDPSGCLRTWARVLMPCTELARTCCHPFGQRRGRSRVWIREAKVWGRRYGRGTGMESEV